MISRRHFVASSAGWLAGSALLALPAGARPARPLRPRAGDPEFYEWKELAPNLFAGLNRTGENFDLVGGNSVLAVAAGAGLLIDTKQAVLGPSLLREVLARTGGLARAINTHHHFDHAGGNHALHAAGIPISAHPRAVDRLKPTSAADGMIAQLDAKVKALEASDLPGAKAAGADAAKFRDHLADVPPQAWVPTDIIGADATLSLAGRKVEVRWFGGGHTDNDLVIRFPDVNVVVTGDLVFNGLHAYYDASADANTARWQKSLRAVEGLCNATTTVVPGHGAVGNVESIRAQITYFDRMREYVAAAMKAGKTREEIVKMEGPDAYKGYALKMALGYLLGGLFDEMSPPKPKEEPAGAKKPSGA